MRTKRRARRERLSRSIADNARRIRAWLDLWNRMEFDRPTVATGVVASDGRRSYTVGDFVKYIAKP